MEYTVKEAERRRIQLEETQTLLVSERERAEIAQKREEDERRQKEDAQKQKEEALAKLEAAVDTLMANGISREDARKTLGLD